MNNLEITGFKELKKEELKQVEGGIMAALLILGIISAWALVCYLYD